MSNPFLQRQQEYNARSRGYWETAAGHRRAVTELVCQCATPAGGGLAVLGAGNLNDLDLGRLGQTFDHVDLVDLDAEALQHGLAFQRAPEELVRTHTPIDVTGVFDSLPESGADASDEAIDRLIAAALDPPGLLDASCAVVASTCLISQLFDGVVQALGSDHPRLHEVLFAIRAGHLGLMSRTLAPGGVGVLITDFVSSDTAPELITCPPYAWEKVLRGLINANNFFVGLNPMRVQQVIVELATELEIHPESIVCHAPWRWQFGPRVFAVTAYTFQKLATG